MFDFMGFGDWLKVIALEQAIIIALLACGFGKRQ